MKRLRGTICVMGAAVSLGLPAVGIRFWIHADRQDARWRDPENTKPIRAPIDLSKRGEYRVDYEPKLSWSHGQVTFVLETDPPILEGEDTRQALTGLVGHMKYVEPSGDFGQGPLQPNVTVRLGESGPILGRWGGRVEAGRYSIVLSVAEPAPRLAGRRQELVVRFRFCPCEYAWPVFFGHAIALACFLVSVLVGSLTILSMLRPPCRHQGTPSLASKS